MALSGVRCAGEVSGRLLRSSFCLRRIFPSSELAASTLRSYSSTPSSAATPASGGWDVVGAVALERKPIIVPELNALEKEYLNILRAAEVEASLLSDHELQLIEDKKRKVDSEEGVTIKVQTAQDLEDEWFKKSQEFRPAPRLTEADAKDDRHSTHRCLDQPLLLVVNQQLGKGHRWILPQAVHADGETVRQTAERALAEVCGPTLEAFFLGHAPAGFYTYNYPAEFQKNGVQGAKVFFFKAQLRSGTLSVSDLKKLKKAEDFAWLTYKQLGSQMLPRYHKAVRSFLMAPEETPYQHLLDRAFLSVTRRKAGITPEIPAEKKATVKAGKS